MANQVILYLLEIIYIIIVLFLPGYITIYYLTKDRRININNLAIIIGLSIAINSIIIFIMANVFNWKNEVLIFSPILSSLLCLILKHIIKKKIKIRLVKNHISSKIVFLSFLFLILILMIIPRMDYIQPRKKENRIAGLAPVEDDFKHLGIMNSIKKEGLKGLNPFFPYEKLLYYKFYYIIPASISKITGIESNLIFLIYSIITTFLFVSIFKLIAFQTAKKNELIQYLGLSMVTVIGGLDIIPGIMYNTKGLLDAWSISMSNGFRVILPLDYIIFTPQHLFAITLFLMFVYFYYIQKMKGITMIMLYCPILIAVFGMSVFIGLFSYACIILYEIISNIKHIKKLFNKRRLIWASIMLFSFLILFKDLFSSSRGFISTYLINTNYNLNIILDYLIFVFIQLPLEYGLIFFLFIYSFYYIHNTKKINKNTNNYGIFWLSGTILIFLLITILKSRDFNDWGMKGSFMLSIFMTLFILSSLNNKIKIENLKKNKFITIIITLIIIIGLSSTTVSLKSKATNYLYLYEEDYKLMKSLKEDFPKSKIIIKSNNAYLDRFFPVVSEKYTIVSETMEKQLIRDSDKLIDMTKAKNTLFHSDNINDIDSSIKKLHPDLIMVDTRENNKHLVMYLNNNKNIKKVIKSKNYVIYKIIS